MIQKLPSNQTYKYFPTWVCTMEYVNNQSELERNNQLRELNLKQNKSLINKLKAVLILTTLLQ